VLSRVSLAGYEFQRVTRLCGCHDRTTPTGRIQKGMPLHVKRIMPLHAPLRHAKDQNTKSFGLRTALTYLEVIYSTPCLPNGQAMTVTAGGVTAAKKQETQAFKFTHRGRVVTTAR
jgi:hypothetical protein